MGTWSFTIEDEVCILHNIKILNTLYAPDVLFCLLSTQHSSQQSQPEGTHSLIRHDKRIAIGRGEGTPRMYY